MRAVLRFQVGATVAIALVAAGFAGPRGGLSAILGGTVNFLACVAYALFASFGSAPTAISALRVLLRAESVKIIVVVLMLWLVLSLYKDIVMPAFFASFIVTAFAYGAALTVRR